MVYCNYVVEDRARLSANYKHIADKTEYLIILSPRLAAV